MNRENNNGGSAPEDTPKTSGAHMYQHEFQALDLAFLGSLVPGIIHNLATPLSGVLGATQLLEKRASTIEGLLKEMEQLSQAEKAEIEKQFDRNRTNVEILARNAKHLADILQAVVHRINRGNGMAEEYYSLSELVQNELRFLDSNLNFKHKVKKQVALGNTTPTAKYVYGHVASAIDEFVVSTMAHHDFQRGLMEMDFSTEASDTHVAVVLAGRFTPRSAEDPDDTLEPYLDRLRAAGWQTDLVKESTERTLRLSCPRRDPA